MMAANLGDTESRVYARIRKSTGKLLDRLIRHHDYNMPRPPKKIAKPERLVFVPFPQHSAEYKELWFGLPEVVGPPRIDDIKRVVCKYFDISHTDMIGMCREKKVIFPRHVAMYLAKEIAGKSFPDIGRYFGDRDHTTAMHAVKRIKTLCLTDPAVAHDVAHLQGVFA